MADAPIEELADCEADFRYMRFEREVTDIETGYGACRA